MDQGNDSLGVSLFLELGDRVQFGPNFTRVGYILAFDGLFAHVKVVGGDVESIHRRSLCYYPTQSQIAVRRDSINREWDYLTRERRRCIKAKEWEVATTALELSHRTILDPDEMEVNA